jgi:hypothetical protein
MFASRIGFFGPINPTFGNSSLYTTPTSANRYLTITPQTGLVDIKNSNGFTVEYWIYPTNFDTAGGGTTNPGPGNKNGIGATFWSFGPANDGVSQVNRLTLYYFDFVNSAARTISTNNNALVVNTWQNISVVTTTASGNTTFSLYINGIRQQIALSNVGTYGNTVTIDSTTISSNTSFPFLIGKDVGPRLIGYVDEIRVSNINRYSGSSYTVANQPFTDDANTQLLIHCDGTSGSTSFTDSSSFNYTITNNSNLVTISNQVVL